MFFFLLCPAVNEDIQNDTSFAPFPYCTHEHLFRNHFSFGIKSTEHRGGVEAPSKRREAPVYAIVKLHSVHLLFLTCEAYGTAATFTAKIEIDERENVESGKIVRVKQYDDERQRNHPSIS